MDIVKNLWRKFTQTKALEQSSGKLEEDFFESIYRVTYIVGLSHLDRSIGYLLYSSLIKLMIIFVISGEIWYGFTEAKGLDGIASTINVVVLQFITVYRYKSMIDHKDFYKKLVTSMDSTHFDISTKKRRKMVNSWARKNEKNLKLLLALGNCTLVAWFIFPLVDDLEYNLIIGIRLPFHYATPERYPFAYILVMVSFVYVSHFVMVTALILQAHLIHLLCQFSVLADCFENIVDDCSIGFEVLRTDELIDSKEFADKYTKRLGNLVEQHKSILNYTTHLRSILSGPMLGQLAASGTLICFIAYQTASSKKIAEAVYCSGWENGLWKTRGVRSALMFIIARANKPLVFTAGGMYDLSIAAYGSLLKASYSALTVLLRLE